MHYQNQSILYVKQTGVFIAGSEYINILTCFLILWEKIKTFRNDITKFEKCKCPKSRQGQYCDQLKETGTKSNETNVLIRFSKIL